MTDATRSELLGKLKLWGDTALKTKCEPVLPGEDLSFLYTMRKVCNATSNGVGLAAPQIGVLKRAIFINPDRDKYGRFMVNPEIIHASPEMIKWTEGCLSYPGYTIKTTRHKHITVRYFDKDMSGPHTWMLSDFASVIVQHELDHCSGVCALEDAWLSQTR